MTLLFKAHSRILRLLPITLLASACTSDMKGAFSGLIRQPNLPGELDNSAQDSPKVLDQNDRQNFFTEAVFDSLTTQLADPEVFKSVSELETNILLSFYNFNDMPNTSYIFGRKITNLSVWADATRDWVENVVAQYPTFALYWESEGILSATDLDFSKAQNQILRALELVDLGPDHFKKDKATDISDSSEMKTGLQLLEEQTRCQKSIAGIASSAAVTPATEEAMQGVHAAEAVNEREENTTLIGGKAYHSKAAKVAGTVINLIPVVNMANQAANVEAFCDDNKNRQEEEEKMKKNAMPSEQKAYHP